MSAPLTIERLNALDYKEMHTLNDEEFRSLLENSDRVRDWPKIKPSVLERLPVSLMEVLLDMLPQCGAIKAREWGKLRVLSLGFNVHVGGTDWRCPFPIDFCVRVNGHQAAVNVLIRPSPSHFRLEYFEGLETGPKCNLRTALRHLAKAGLDKLHHYELLYLSIFRPASQSGMQMGTAGGTFEPNDTAEGRLLQETKEEFKGFEYKAWELLLKDQTYQSGNIYELQSIGAVLGHIPNEEEVELQGSEGISEWKAVSLAGALEFLQANPDHDAKIDHGLRVLLPLMKDCGIE